MPEGIPVYCTECSYESTHESHVVSTAYPRDGCDGSLEAK